MKIKIFVFLIFSIVLSGFAQKDLNEADALFGRSAYADAALAYESYIANAATVSPETWQRLGYTYYNLKDYVNALKAYKNWRDIDSPDDDVSKGYYYYDTLRRLKEYDKANQMAMIFFSRANNRNKYLNYDEEQSRFVELLQADTLYTVKNLPLNSQYADFAASFYKEDFVFTSSRNKEDNKIYERNKTPYLSIYKISRPEVASEVSLFSEDIETPFHDGTTSFTADGRYMYYASSFQSGSKKVFNDEKRNFFKIYRVDLTQKKLKKELLAFNGDNYSTGQPYITPDGKKLFFASDMPGGYGKADIYVCDVYEDGTTSQPRNLGPEINTIVDDFFPFFKNDVLYFSSAGHVGFGGLDMYKSFYKDGIFGTPINLGPVINTNADDFAYVEGKKPNTGYFSSDRAGGKGDDDIYEFTYNLERCQQFISGTVYDLETKQPLADATVTLYVNENEKYSEIRTDENGEYQLEVLCETKYTIEAHKAGYSKDGLDLSTDVTPGRTMKMLDFKIKDLSDIFTTDGDVEKIKVDPIYFEYYRYNINSVAAIQLQKVVDVMNAYPEMVIKIESHTDQRGTDYFNKVLSTNRAEATRDWLISRGIAANRIESAIGYGESRPINICDEQGVDCTEVEYSENRRSEFIVLRR
ncbi:OmpA family protein [Leeuwenhoekiella parthenopeia]|uniref:OmpA family protein n=1 Tax=Leeuwenhoekiella parthenopeia TaxID=2890320 RepID=A0ABS8GS00_9FLAO|nr:OmpA family protein [Leeuwenhoekiella parthenopeia]MCC4212774.1 OmpA family protein [Leeuwenhoekiella parthenopeia]